MLRKIDKEYLVDCGFEVFNSEGLEKLKGTYPFVNLYNENDEVTDLLSLEIILVEIKSKWTIEKCYTEGEQKDVFGIFFKDATMKSLLEFHRLNNMHL